MQTDDTIVAHLLAGEHLWFSGLTSHAIASHYGHMRRYGLYFHTKVGTRNGVRGLFVWADETPPERKLRTRMEVL